MRDADDTPAKPIRPRRGRRYRKETRYIHQRSEGLSSRRNDGSAYIKEDDMADPRVDVQISAAQALSLDAADPRRNDGKPKVIGPPTWYGDMPDFKWIVEGWNDGLANGRTAYMHGWETGAQAAEYAAELRLKGDAAGIRYDHYDVIYMNYAVVVVQRTLSIEEARGYDGLS